MRLISEKEYFMVRDYLSTDFITNYFIITALDRYPEKKTFEKVWIKTNGCGYIEVVLLKRRSGNFQIYSHTNYDADEVIQILKDEKAKSIIGKESILKPLIEKVGIEIKVNAYIAELKELKSLDIDLIEVKELEIHDLYRVEEVYKEVFKSYLPIKEYEKHILNHTGRGFYISVKGEMVSIAQSIYESSKEAVLAGIATKNDYRKMGYSSACTYKLCKQLLKEGKRVVLQYEDEWAGYMYHKMGFTENGKIIKVNIKIN